MARLIDADAIESDIQKMLVPYGDGTHSGDKEAMIYDEALAYVLEALDKAPTVDAVPVVHGHWCWEGRFKACSVCGSYIDWDDTLGANHWSYCPYCGAKMDGGAENA